MKKKLQADLLCLCILIPIAVGSLSAYLSNSKASYQMLTKPPLTPPASVFPIVWTILYVLMGISCYLIATSGADEVVIKQAKRIYIAQLFFNFMWPILFFRFDLLFVSFIWICILIFLIALMIVAFSRINKTAAYLQIPYLLWCTFAAYLNFAIFWLNK